jgi:hypothetical protein
LLSDAFKLGSSVFREDAANTWGHHFQIPAEAIQADLDLLTLCGGDFNQLIRAKRENVDQKRISPERVSKFLSPENPEFARVMELATAGISLTTPDSYTGVTFDTRPALGRAFLATACAVEKMMFEAYWQRGLAVLVREDEVTRLASFGLCIAGWTTKLNKECGRPLTNGSGRPKMPSAEFINGKETKALAIQRYLAIHHPNVGDAVRMILDYLNKSDLSIDQVTIWKFDLKAAYTLLSYMVEQVAHVGVELREGVFMFFLAGVFGLTSMPFAFDVITRALVWELNNGVLRGVALMFVDDGLVVSPKTHEAEDITATRGLLMGLLGDYAMAEDKLTRALLCDNNLDFIGYNLCLRTQVVTVARHNLLKAVFAFGEVNTEPGAVVTVKTLQRLASLGSRYGGICRLMRPFTRILYSAYRGQQQHGEVPLDNVTRRVITLFKVLLVMTFFQPTRFAVRFSSFTRQSPRYICEFDASLLGIGIIWFHCMSDGSERPIAYTSIDITSLGFGEDSSYQNTAEYIGSLFCIIGLAMLGYGSEPCMFRGDSLSALAWIVKGGVRSDTAIQAAALWAQAAVTFSAIVTGSEHIAGKINSRTDRLSRHGSWLDVLQDDLRIYGRRSLPPNLDRLTINAQPFLQLCNPANPIESELQFISFLGAARDLLAAVNTSGSSDADPSSSHSP